MALAVSARVPDESMITKRALAGFVVLVITALAPRAHAALSGTTAAIGTSNVGVAKAGSSSVTESSAVPETIAAFDLTACSADFSVTTTAPVTVTTGTPATINVSFRPATRGAQSCTVTMRDVGNAALGTFQITGTGQAQELTIVTASPVDFGAVRVAAAAGTTRAITLRNSGDAGFPLQVTSAALSGTNAADYTIVSPTFPQTLAAGATLDVTVKLKPSASGTRVATLTVTTDDPVTAMKAVNLTGVGTNGLIAVTDVDFAIVDDTTTATANVVVTNAAAAPVGPLTVTSATITGGAGWFAFGANGNACTGATTCTFAGGLVAPPSQSVAVTCTPPAAATGTQTAMVTFASDSDAGGSNVATLRCTAGRPVIAVNKPNLDFMNVLVNTTSTAQLVTVSNTGNRNLTFTLTKAGVNASMFAVTGCGSASTCTVVAGASAMFSVTFTPTTKQAGLAAVVHINNNNPDAGSNPTDVALVGNGVAPEASGPASLAFGSIQVGQMSSAMTLTVTNTGTALLHITNAGLTTGSSDYTVLTGTTGAQMTTVAVGASASWSMLCNPLTFGSRGGNFRVSSDAFTLPTLDVPLSCTGQQGILRVAPATFGFGGVREGDVVTSANTIVLSNPGNVAVTGITAMLSSTTIGYSITSTVPTMLAAGGSAIVTVQFAPMAGVDGGPATVTFAGSWGTTPPTATSATLSLTGTGLGVGYDTNPKPTLDFGNERFDQPQTLPLQIIDTASSSVQIQTATIAPGAGTMSGEFAVVGFTHNGTAVALPFTLTGVNDTLVANVRCAPNNRVGALTATLTIHSDLGMTPNRTIDLACNSTSAQLAIDPVSMMLDYGGVDLQASPASLSQAITLTNTGTGPLDVGAATKSGADGARFTFVAPARTVAPNGTFTVLVTYTPTVEKPANAPDQATLTFPLAGINLGPTSAMIALRGHGIDRHIQVGSAPAFPDTFRNPGSTAPTMPVTVKNAGDAPLSISAVMVSGEPVWQLVDPSPVDLPAQTSYDFRVRFAPTQAGKAPDGQLVILDNDKGTPMIVVDLHGRGIDRAVEMGPVVIDLGYTGVGIPVKLSGVAPTELLRVTSTDPSATFKIRTIQLDGGDGSFALDAPPKNATLAPQAVQTFDLTFSPTSPGEFEATATLFLDQDPVAQARVTLRGHGVFVDAHGGGGCATSHGTGGGALLVVGALALVRRRRQRRLAVAVAIAACATGLVAAPRADAEPTRDLELSVFDPTPATTGNQFQLQTATVGASGDWVASALVAYANDPLVLTSVQNDDAAIRNRMMLELGGAYAFLGRFEAGARMPLYVQSGQMIDPLQMAGAAPASGTARGNLALHAKARLWRGALAAGQLDVAAAGVLTLPTARGDEFAGAARPTGRLLALASYAPRALDRRLVVTVNGGASIRSRAAYAAFEQKSGVAFGLGGAYHVLDELWATAELFGDVTPAGKYAHVAGMGAGSALVTIEALAGLHYQLVPAWTLGFAVGRGVVAGPGAPSVQAIVALSYAPRQTIAPIHPPVVDGDADGDGIPDSIDKCPNDPEDKDGFQDADGCPDPDNDGDGIPDVDDKCPNEPEDKDGFEDADGCPDLDNDKDGIPDKDDKCPNDPEDKDGFEDADGCPDLDNDKDGIPDKDDKCPNEPETINGFQDDDGCPDKGDALVVLSPDRIELLEAIQFTRDNKIASKSFNVLGQVAANLRAHTEILRVRITSHVQPSADPDRDQQITDKRAAAIRDWLVQWGIGAKRLEVRGFGGSKTLVPASQRGAAQINDRLELVILDRR